MSTPKPQITQGETYSEMPAELDQGWQRFLSAAIANGLDTGLRHPGDLLRHIAPSDIMIGFRNRPKLRADILAKTTGIIHSIAERKTAESAGADLEIAIEVSVTDASAIVALIDPDDMVRHLDIDRLWRFVTEGQLSSEGRSTNEEDLARKYTAFLLDRALDEKLITPGDIVDRLTAEHIAESLPQQVLAQIMLRALKEGGARKRFTARHVLAVIPPSDLVKHISPARIWSTVLVPKVARVHGFSSGAKPSASSDEPPRAQAVDPTVMMQMPAAPPEIPDMDEPPTVLESAHVAGFLVEETEYTGDYQEMLSASPPIAPPDPPPATRPRGKTTPNGTRRRTPRPKN